MYTVVQKGPLTVVGIICRTSNAADAGTHDIPRHWQRFASEGVANNISNKASDDVLALYCEYDGDYTQPYSFLIGCPVHSTKDIPPGFVAVTIPGGFYAKFCAQGEYPQSVVTTWGEIWQQSALRSRARIKRAYTCDFEVYTKDFFSGESQSVDIFVAKRL
jgi:predicted transcriptional regulator YdeE